ncbi:hypothetical protein QFC21_006069 [Naganishia friedmannii]|uniref:Uncharacterized protein n=1 Tax=Naganishia friedmannii TaxID=89922 RepID=A0ACC2V559_9TREE|nr:hypothetical protein QFC21_006069 [Naganishia friedmannii]
MPGHRGTIPLPRSSQRGQIEDAAELAAFERTLKDRIHNLQSPPDNNQQAWTAALPTEVEALGSNFESYLRMARKMGGKREEEMERLMRKNENLQLLLERANDRVTEMTVEIADLRQEVSGGPRLPMELHTIIAGFLAGSNAYGSLANFNLASKAVHTETRPVLNETMLLDSKEYWWTQTYELDPNDEEIIDGTSESQREAWRQVKYLVIRKSVDDAESDLDLSHTLFHQDTLLFPDLKAILMYGLDQKEILHIRKPTSRDAITDFLNIPLWREGTWGPSAVLERILFHEEGEITGPMVESDHYWFRMDWDNRSDYHLTSNDPDVMRRNLQHVWRILPPPASRKEAMAYYEANSLTIDQPEPFLDSDHGSLSFVLSGSIDHLGPFIQALKELHLRNPDLEAIEIRWFHCAFFPTDRYFGLLRPIADVYRKLWESGIKPTLRIEAERILYGMNAYKQASGDDNQGSGSFRTCLRPAEDGGKGFIMETAFIGAHHFGHGWYPDISYPQATQSWEPTYT